MNHETKRMIEILKGMRSRPGMYYKDRYYRSMCIFVSGYSEGAKIPILDQLRHKFTNGGKRNGNLCWDDALLYHLFPGHEDPVEALHRGGEKSELAAVDLLISTIESM